MSALQLPVRSCAACRYWSRPQHIRDDKHIGRCRLQVAMLRLSCTVWQIRAQLGIADNVVVEGAVMFADERCQHGYEPK